MLLAESANDVDVPEALAVVDGEEVEPWMDSG